MKEPDVSVVTVVCNGVAHVGETIESVLAQTGIDLEYWVIDGGSTDGTVEVVGKYAARLAGWTSEPDRGIADAFNKGLARVRGKYVMFLNADDALAKPDALEQLVAFARQHEWPDVVYGDCDVYAPDTGDFLYRVTINFDRARFIRLETIPHPSMLMRRRYFERFGKFDTSFKVAMDYELFLRGVPETGALRAPILVTRVRAGGISTRDRSLVVEETIRALKKNGFLTRLGELRMRASYAARGAARWALAATGLYSAFVAIRRRRNTSSNDARRASR